MVLSRTRFLMTSSTLEELRERRVEKRPWILEKSMETTFIISSIASWLVTTIQTRPPHLSQNCSTRVWRLSMRLTSPLRYWPISSTMNSRRNFFPHSCSRLVAYSLMSETSSAKSTVTFSVLSAQSVTDLTERPAARFAASATSSPKMS